MDNKKQEEEEKKQVKPTTEKPAPNPREIPVVSARRLEQLNEGVEYPFRGRKKNNKDIGE